ncbi:helix-turn-helix domain-containing protein [Cronobacter sakazakii]
MPVLPVSRQKRPEGLSGGARNGCYGKFACNKGYKKPPSNYESMINVTYSPCDYSQHEGIIILSTTNRKILIMESLLLSKVSFVIKKIRLEKGMTQEDLAYKSNLDRTYISGVERNSRNITIKTLGLIIKGLGVSDVIFFELLIKEISTHG